MSDTKKRSPTRFWEIVVIKRILLIVLGIVVLGTAFFFFNFTVRLPRDISVPEITLPDSAEAIERGRYMATHVAVCMDCHWEDTNGLWRHGRARLDLALIL